MSHNGPSPTFVRHFRLSYYFNQLDDHLKEMINSARDRGSKFIPYGKLMLVIVDTNYWVKNERELLPWISDNTKNRINTVNGMVLEFEDEYERDIFLLRWDC